MGQSGRGAEVAAHGSSAPVHRLAMENLASRVEEIERIVGGTDKRLPLPENSLSTRIAAVYQKLSQLEKGMPNLTEIAARRTY